jgi:ParB family chromosome partitioning protein
MVTDRKRKALGKGLEALIPEVKEEGYLAIDDIMPNRFQPRINIKEEGIRELSASIKEKGIIQPIIVRRVEGGYEIVAGERRWRAAKIAGIRDVPVIIKDLSDREVLELSIIENIQREDLNPIELANGYKRLIEEFGFTQEELAKRLGKDRSTITNHLRLLKLPENIQDGLRNGIISSGHGRALLSLKREEEFNMAIEEIYKKRLSVRDTESLVKRIKKKKTKKEDREFGYIREEIEGLLKTMVKIEKKRDHGVIKIHFFSMDELDRIIEIIRKGSLKC